MADGKTLKEAAAEKLGKVLVVNGITVEGVTPETLNDFDYIEALATLSDETAEPMEKLRAMASMGPVVFGAKQWKRIKSELREQNGGRLTNETVMDFLDALMAELNAKN